MVIVYAWGSISGAHVNPAVTFGIAVGGPHRLGQGGRRIGLRNSPARSLAAYLLQWLLAAEHGLGPTIGSLDAARENTGDALKVIVVEGVLTFFLVTAVFASGIHGRNGNMAGVPSGWC